MHIENEIKRRPDGSIDTGYYMQIGRDLRSAKAHELAQQLVAKPQQKRSGIIGRIFSPVRVANS